MRPSNTGKSPENAITPSSLNRLAKNTIESHLGNLWLIGEVTDLYQAPSGHAYFALKDHKSSIKCTFFKQYNFKNTKINNGDKLLVLGFATLYEERGTFQLKVERVEKSGIGALAQAYAELKLKLESLGYFDPEKKTKLPPMVTSLAIVTSRSSAAIKDVLNIIKRRNPLLKVQIYHASVQGEKAVEEIIDALLMADINNHDAILLTRGGGSDEDLWTFNDVSIAQTLFNLETPCISAVGHETDTSISDLVADVSAITPSAAAELLTPDLSHIKGNILNNKKNLYQLIKSRVYNLQQQMDISYHQLHRTHPKNAIDQEQQRVLQRYHRIQQAINMMWQNKNQQFLTLNHTLLRSDFNINTQHNIIDHKKTRLINAIKQHLEHCDFQIQNTSGKLNTLSPLTTLSRGYSITLKHNTGQVVNDDKDVKTGDVIETILKTGRLVSTISHMNNSVDDKK